MLLIIDDFFFLSGDTNLVPSGLPEHALPGNNMDANLPTNQPQQAVILSPSAGLFCLHLLISRVSMSLLSITIFAFF